MSSSLFSQHINLPSPEPTSASAPASIFLCMDPAPLSYCKNHFTNSLWFQSASVSKGVSGQISTSFGFLCAHLVTPWCVDSVRWNQLANVVKKSLFQVYTPRWIFVINAFKTYICSLLTIITTTSTDFCGPTAHSEPVPPHYRGFTITLRHTTLGRTPLEEWSARRRDLYLTAHNNHNR